MNNNTENFKINKKKFLELYEKAKNNEIDLNTIPPEILKNMCKLLEEEVKIKEIEVERLKAKLNDYS